jgi:hypothetical protein
MKAILWVGAVVGAGAIALGQPRAPERPASDPPLPRPVEPDWRSVPQLTPEQIRQREEEALARLAASGLEFSLVGITTIPPEHATLGQVGGLSGLAHLGDNRFLAVSDSSKASVAYELRLALTPTDNPERFAVGVEVAGAPMEIAHAAVDAEGVAMLPNHRGLVIGYERPPTVAVYLARAEGVWSAVRVSLPEGLADDIRHNRAFESVMVREAETGQEIWAATEAAPNTDGAEATTEAGTRCRVVVCTGREPKWERELVYVTEPGPDGPLKVSFNSLSEFCALPDGRFLALERGFSPIRGFHADIFLLDGSTRAPATEGGLPELIKARVARVRDLGVHMPLNLEAMALGPRMADLTGDADQKGRALVLIADDNFGSDGMVGSQVVVVRVMGLDPEDAERAPADGE